MSIGRLVLAAVVSAPLIAAPMSAGFNYGPKWWLLLPVGIFAQMVVYYLLLDVTRVGSASVKAGSANSA